jgi:hypothetical protein
MKVKLPNLNKKFMGVMLTIGGVGLASGRFITGEQWLDPLEVVLITSGLLLLQN